MRNATIALVILAAAAVASADEVVLSSGLTYANIRVTDVSDFRITYRLRSGRTPEPKELSKVASVKINSLPAFNEAERLLGQKKYAEAVKAYDEVAKKTRRPWQNRLIAYRRLRALNALGKIARGVEEWLRLTDEVVGSKVGLPLALKTAPARLAAKGDRENARAISALEKKAREVKNADYLLAIRQMLLKLYTREGMADKAAAIARIIQGGTTGPSKGPNGGAKFQAGLEAARVLLEQGKADEVITSIGRNLRNYSHEQLSTALLLLGRAQFAKAQKTKDRVLMLKAGLNLMRVVAFFPAGEDAPEALYYVAGVNVALGNRNAAQRALKRVAEGKSKFASKAKRDLEAMKKETKASGDTGR